MNNISLPDPIELSDFCKTYEEAIYFVYNEYLKNGFFNKEKRAKLNGKFIYIEMKRYTWIKGLPERYWHLITFEDGMKYSMDPCLNLEDRKFCKKNKDKCNINLYTPSNVESLKNRTECIYRLRRVNRINTIIRLANEGDKRIKMWEKNNKSSVLVFIRYQEEVYDHIVILRTLGDMYQFITSYPVGHRKVKSDFDRDYLDYLKSK